MKHSSRIIVHPLLNISHKFFFFFFFFFFFQLQVYQFHGVFYSSKWLTSFYNLPKYKDLESLSVQ